MVRSMGFWPNEQDICSYRMALVKTAIMTVGLGFVAILCAASLGDSLAWFVSGIIHGFEALNVFGALGASLVLIAGVFLITVALRTANTYIMEHKSTAGPPGALHVMWDSLVKKYCVPIEFVRGNNEKG